MVILDEIPTTNTQIDASNVVSNIIAGIALLLSLILFGLRFYDRCKNKNRYFADLLFSESYKAFCEAHKDYIKIKYPKNQHVKVVLDAMYAFSDSFSAAGCLTSRRVKRLKARMIKYEDSLYLLISKKGKNKKRAQVIAISKNFYKIGRILRAYL